MTNSLKSEKGFSLIEVMVGLTVGLIVLLVVTQTWSVYENQRRTTAAGAGAVENGLLALHMIEQEVKKAGAGLTNPDIMSCRNFYSYYKEDAAGTGGPKVGFATLPIAIQDGGSGSDTIVVRSGGQFVGSVPTLMAAPPMAQTDSDITVQRAYGFKPNDLIVVTDRINCTLMKITKVTGMTFEHKNNVSDTSALPPVSSPPEYNPTRAYMDSKTWPTYAEGALVFNVGVPANQGVLTRSFGVDGATLVATDAGAPAAVPLIDGVVSIQAQYGVAATATAHPINQWVDATGTDWVDLYDTSSLNAAKIANLQRIRAVRVAVIARSSARGPANTTSTCTSSTGTANKGPCPWEDVPAATGMLASPAPAVDLSAADANWSNYRYRVYQTVIPLRNMVWTDFK